MREYSAYDDSELGILAAYNPKEASYDEVIASEVKTAAAMANEQFKTFLDEAIKRAEEDQVTAKIEQAAAMGEPVEEEVGGAWSDEAESV